LAVPDAPLAADDAAAEALPVAEALALLSGAVEDAAEESVLEPAALEPEAPQSAVKSDWAVAASDASQPLVMQGVTLLRNAGCVQRHVVSVRPLQPASEMPWVTQVWTQSGSDWASAKGTRARRATKSIVSG